MNFFDLIFKEDEYYKPSNASWLSICCILRCLSNLRSNLTKTNLSLVKKNKNTNYKREHKLYFDEGLGFFTKTTFTNSSLIRKILLNEYCDRHDYFITNKQEKDFYKMLNDSEIEFYYYEEY
jgi:hypothetical protein